jgi:hypothetical protein
MLATRTIGVRLNADELAALRAIAGREDRDPRRQAARLVREGLIREGALTELNSSAGVEPASAGAAR